MSEAKVNSEDIEMVFQRLRALPGNKVNIFLILSTLIVYCVFSIHERIHFDHCYFVFYHRF